MSSTPAKNKAAVKKPVAKPAVKTEVKKPVAVKAPVKPAAKPVAKAAPKKEATKPQAAVNKNGTSRPPVKKAAPKPAAKPAAKTEPKKITSFIDEIKNAASKQLSTPALSFPVVGTKQEQKPAAAAPAVAKPSSRGISVDQLLSGIPGQSIQPFNFPTRK